MYFAAGAGVVAVLFAGVLLAGQLAEILGPSAGSAAASPERDATPPGGQSPGGSPDGQVGTCTRQSVSAPGPGGWRVATRRGDLQLVSQRGSTRLIFRIYGGGSSDSAAEVTAELVPVNEVEPRYGVAGPVGGDAALVVTFSGEFRASGNRFQLGSVGAVSGVVLSDVESGLIAVAGVRGSGCFELGVDGWAADGAARSATVVVDIER